MRSLKVLCLAALLGLVPTALAQSASDTPELTPAESLAAGQAAADDRSWRTARTHYRAACDGGEIVGCTGLADLYHRGQGGILSESTAERLYRQACRGDDFNACTTLGYLYNTGLDGAPDLDASRQYYQKGCDGEVLSACAALGNQLYNGVGGRHDRAKGKRLLEETCDDGFSWSCTRLVDLGFSKRDAFQK